MNKVRSCDFEGAIRAVDNWDRFDNNRYRNQLQSCDFIEAVKVAVIKIVGVADNRGRFDDNQCEDRLLNWRQPEILYKGENIVMSR